MKKDNTIVTWSHIPDDWDLRPDQVDIWRVFLDLSADSTESIESVLSADEVQRAEKFHFPQDRNRFVLAHGATRAILARYLHCRPKQLIFFSDKYGKPSIPDHNLQFNLSHSGNYALLAVSSLHKVGVDVEHIRPEVEIESLARRYFSQTEQIELMDFPSEQRITVFYRYWTLKEAYIKAHGLGLSLPLDSFDVSILSNDSNALKATRPDPNDASQWNLQTFVVDVEYSGAVAVENSNPEFRYWNWNSETRD